MDYRDNRQRWAESHQVVHFYAGQWCTFTPALTPSRAVVPPDASRACRDGRTAVRRATGKRHPRRSGPRPPSSALYRIGEGWETLARVADNEDDNSDDGNNDETMHSDHDTDGDAAGDGEALSAPVRFRRGWMLGDGTGCARAARSPPSFSTTGCRGRRRALMAVRLRQAARGRPPRLGGDRRQRSRHHPIGQVPPGGRYSSRGRNPVRHLCNLALARPPGESARASNRSSAGSRTAWTKTPAMPLAASSCSTRRTPWQTPPDPRDHAAIRPPRSRDAPDCVCRTPCPMPYPLCLRHRGYYRARPGLCAAPRALGRR